MAVGRGGEQRAGHVAVAHAYHFEAFRPQRRGQFVVGGAAAGPGQHRQVVDIPQRTVENVAAAHAAFIERGIGMDVREKHDLDVRHAVQAPVDALARHQAHVAGQAFPRRHDDQSGEALRQQFCGGVGRQRMVLVP